MGFDFFPVGPLILCLPFATLHLFTLARSFGSTSFLHFSKAAAYASFSSAVGSYFYGES